LNNKEAVLRNDQW